MGFVLDRREPFFELRGGKFVEFEGVVSFEGFEVKPQVFLKELGSARIRSEHFDEVITLFIKNFM